MIFGWDISTSVIGFVAFDNQQKFVEAQYCDLSKVDGNLLDKADIAYTWILKLRDQYLNGKFHGEILNRAHKHFIEDRLAGFSGGGSNAGTVMRLAAFNHSVSWMVWHEFANPGGGLVEYIHPSTAKAQMKQFGLVIPKGSKEKKKLTLDWVVAREPSFPLELNRNENPKPHCFDQADAYITAIAGARKFGGA